MKNRSPYKRSLGGSLHGPYTVPTHVAREHHHKSAQEFGHAELVRSRDRSFARALVHFRMAAHSCMLACLLYARIAIFALVFVGTV